MFSIYSQDGQRALSVPQFQTDMMKVTKPKSSPAFGESALDQENLIQGRSGSNLSNNAIAQYQNNADANQGQPVVFVGDIMSRNVVSIQADEPIHHAWELMQEKDINHIVVFDNREALVGVISSRDILQKTIVAHDGSLEGVNSRKVRDLMDPKVIATQAKTDIRRIAMVMSEYKISCILIEGMHGKLLGVVTLSDLVRRLAKQPPIRLYI